MAVKTAIRLRKIPALAAPTSRTPILQKIKATAETKIAIYKIATPVDKDIALTWIPSYNAKGAKITVEIKGKRWHRYLFYCNSVEYPGRKSSKHK